MGSERGEYVDAVVYSRFLFQQIKDFSFSIVDIYDKSSE